MTFTSQATFTGGEIAPSLYARVDLDKYRTGAKLLKNFIVHPHGGASNRPGMMFIDEVCDSNYKSRLVPFMFSVTQAYTLEFSELKMRILKDGGIVENAGVSVEIATPWSAAEVDDLDFTQSADVLYVVHSNHPPHKISRSSHVDWSIDKIEFSDGPYASASNFDWESQDIVLKPNSHYSDTVNIVSPTDIFTSSMVGQRLRLGYFDPYDIANIAWRIGKITSYTSPSNVTVDFKSYREVLGHSFVKNHRFYEGLADWEDHSTGVSTIKFQAGRYARLTHGASGIADLRQEVTVKKNNSVNLVFEVSNVPGTININVKVGTTLGGAELVGTQTLTAAGIVTKGFNTGDNTKIHLTIETTGSTSGDIADVSMAAIVTDQRETNQWRVPAWTDETGYPRAISFYEQRLVFASSIEEPTTYWLSRTGDYENFGFTTPLQDDDSFQFTLASRRLDDIRWLVPFGELLAGTSGAEWAISRAEDSNALTPTSIFARPQSYRGSADIKPIVIGKSVLFVQHGGNAVQDLQYAIETNDYAPFNLSVFSNHLFEGKQIVSWAYARNPDSIIWCILDNGTLLGLTYLKEQEIWAWHQHETDGKYEAVCVLTNETPTDEVYFIVKRNINGVEKRYIELLMPRIKDALSHDFFFVDCGATYNGTPTTVISGLDHIEGKEVSILADGSVLPRQTVTGGQITLALEASLVHIGIPYVSDMKTLSMEFTDDLGTSQGRLKLISRVIVRVSGSRGIWVGPDENRLQPEKIRDETMGEDPIPLQSNDVEFTFDAGYSRLGEILIRNTDPIPVTVLAIISEMKISQM